MSWKQMLGKERHIPRVQLQLSTTAHIFYVDFLFSPIVFSDLFYVTYCVNFGK